MKTYGIALWGLGKHAQNRLLPAISSHNSLSLIGVCSRTEEKVKSLSELWNCEGWSNADEMLCNQDIDIILISTPIGVHYKLSKKALEAGKHVWCEKPLTCDFKQTIKLVNLAKKHNKMLVECFMYLYHSQFKRVEDFIYKEENGLIESVICRFGIPNLTQPGFRVDPNLCGGAFWDVASYPISAVVKLFPGQFDKILFSEIIKDENKSIDKKGKALLRLSSDISVFLEWGVGVSYRNEIDVWAEKKSFYTDRIFSKPDKYKPKYIIRDEFGKELHEFGKVQNQFLEMFTNFLNVIDSPDKIHGEYKCILERAKVMDKVYQSLNKFVY